jgi:hypothetical protein
MTVAFILGSIAVDLPFFSRPPLYVLHIAQLVLGVACIRLFRSKEPISDRSGRIYINQQFMRAAFLILGLAAVLLAISGFVLDWFWRFSH